MRQQLARLLVVSMLFLVCVVPVSADARGQCIVFCILNEIECLAGGNIWHLNCGDVNSYWIEETQTCELGVGPCEIIQ